MRLISNQNSPTWAKTTFVGIAIVFLLWLIPNAYKIVLSDLYSLSAKNTIADYGAKNTFNLALWLTANKELKDALNIAPDDPNILFSMGQLNAIRGYKTKGNRAISKAYYEEAALLYESSLKIRPRDALTWVNYVIVLDAINAESSRISYPLHQAQDLTKNEKTLADIVGKIEVKHKSLNNLFGED